MIDLQGIFEQSVESNEDLLTTFQVDDSLTDLLFLTLERIMSQSVELSLEQKFSIRSFETQVEKMSHEQAQDFLIKLYEQMIMRETMYRHFLKHQWGLEAGPQMP